VNEEIPGYSPQKWVGGRFIGVCKLTFGRARIVIGDRWSVDDGW
jgi:hypothetical protein